MKSVFRSLSLLLISAVALLSTGYITDQGDRVVIKLSEDDAFIINAVLQHMQNGQAKFFPFSASNGPIVVQAKTTGVLPYPQIASVLTPPQSPVDQELIKRHKSRNEQYFAEISKSHLSNNALVGNADDDLANEWGSMSNHRYSKRYQNAKGWLWFSLPGYSEKGDKAYVFLWFGPAGPGAEAHYYLVRTDNGWNISWHDHR